MAPDVQGGDSSMDVPPVSDAPGLVSGEAPSPVFKVPPSQVMSVAQCPHVSSRRVVRPAYLGDCDLRGEECSVVYSRVRPLLARPSDACFDAVDGA